MPRETYHSCGEIWGDLGEIWGRYGETYHSCELEAQTSVISFSQTSGRKGGRVRTSACPLERWLGDESACPASRVPLLRVDELGHVVEDVLRDALIEHDGGEGPPAARLPERPPPANTQKSRGG